MPATFVENKVVSFVVETCCMCGVKFAMTEEYRQRRVNDRGLFYCPNGHSQLYTGKTDAQRAREERDAAQARATRLLAMVDQKDAELKTLERRRRASVGAATRVRNRIKNGVCPCCDRHFVALADHMRTQHPEFRPADAEPADADETPSA